MTPCAASVQMRPFSLGGSKPYSSLSLSFGTRSGFSAMPTVRSPWTFARPRTGRLPAPTQAPGAPALRPRPRRPAAPLPCQAGAPLDLRPLRIAHGFFKVRKAMRVRIDEGEIEHPLGAGLARRVVGFDQGLAKPHQRRLVAPGLDWGAL